MNAEKHQELEQIASQVRRDIVRMVHGVGNGHPGGALGCADILTALYFEVMEHSTNFNMDGIGEDLFFLSNGHISAVQYSAMARAGYFPVAELATHRKINSRLQGHPATAKKLPGVRMASGSLGQGLSVAVGAAQTKKLNQDDHHVFVLMGDGELQEGQVWEAAMYAAANHVDQVVAMVDYNGRQIDGNVDQVLSLGDLAGKWAAFGWHVIVASGNDMPEVVKALNKAKLHKGQPSVILFETEMGQGVDFMVGTHKWHGVAPNDEQLTSALAQLEETLGDY